MLNPITPVGRLQRMTTWKVRLSLPAMEDIIDQPSQNLGRLILTLTLQSKLAVSKNAADEESITEADLKLGLLAYPVLQAADIMLYKSVLSPQSFTPMPTQYINPNPPRIAEPELVVAW